MFAPKPFDVAKEMVRVTRPGGRIVMGNWIPNDPTLVAQILKISSAYTPPPPEGFISPMTWGVESNVIERFGGAGIPEDKISFVRDTYTFNYPAHAIRSSWPTFRSYYGPTMNAFDAAEKNGRAADLQRELETLFNSQNKSPTQGRHVDSCDLPARDGRRCDGLLSLRPTTSASSIDPRGTSPSARWRSASSPGSAWRPRPARAAP